MARAPHVAGIPDIRSWALYHDVAETKKYIKPGQNMNKILHNLYVPEAIEQANRSKEEMEKRPFKKHKFDTPRDKVNSMCACILVSTVTGIMHSYAAIIPSMQVAYGITYYDAVIVVGATYAIFISFGPFVSGLIGSFGIRATCGIGMLLLFGGFLLDGLTLGKFGLYISHFVLLAIGGSFVCTAAMSSVVDHLRVELETVIFILAVTCPVGTVFYYSFLHFLFGYGFSYKWIHMALAILTLVLTSLVHLLPVREEKYHSDPFNSHKYKQHIMDCIDKENNDEDLWAVAESDDSCDEDCDSKDEGGNDDLERGDDGGGDCEINGVIFGAIDCEAKIGGPTVGDCSMGEDEVAVPEEPHDWARSYVCDCSMMGDCSFMVWAIASCFVVMPFYANALFLVCYTNIYKTDTDPPPLLVIWYVLFQTVGRISIMAIKDFSFKFTFYTFEGLLIVNIIMMQLMKKTVSYGWVAFWTIFAAPVEGALMSMIPMVTLGTLPRNATYFGWGMLVFLSGLGSGFGVIFIFWLTDEFGYNGYSQGYNSMCVAYVGVMIFVSLIPNEEIAISQFTKEYLTVHNRDKLKKINSEGDDWQDLDGDFNEGEESDGGKRRQLGEEFRVGEESGQVEELSLDCLVDIPEVNLEESTRPSDLDYFSLCHICKQFGAIPECGCVPLGLVTVDIEDDPNCNEFLSFEPPSTFTSSAEEQDEGYEDPGL